MWHDSAILCLQLSKAQFVQVSNDQRGNNNYQVMREASAWMKILDHLCIFFYLTLRTFYLRNILKCNYNYCYNCCYCFWRHYILPVPRSVVNWCNEIEFFSRSPPAPPPYPPPPKIKIYLTCCLGSSVMQIVVQGMESFIISCYYSEFGFKMKIAALESQAGLFPRCSWTFLCCWKSDGN